MKEWKCKDCEVFDTHLCHFPNMKSEYKACEHVVVDHNQAYEQGREDKEKEIKEKSVFYSNKPIEQIVLEVRTDAIDECIGALDDYIEFPMTDEYVIKECIRVLEQLKWQNQTI